MRPKFSVVDLQQIGAAAPAAPPSDLIQNPAAVQPVNGIHQPNQCDALGSMLCLGHQVLVFERAKPYRIPPARHPADLIASQHFDSFRGQDFLLVLNKESARVAGLWLRGADEPTGSSPNYAGYQEVSAVPPNSRSQFRQKAQLRRLQVSDPRLGRYSPCRIPS